MLPCILSDKHEAQAVAGEVLVLGRRALRASSKSGSSVVRRKCVDLASCG